MELEKNKIKFAVVGHPNEGKSSLVACLVEDDSIAVSPWPGETDKSRAYSVKNLSSTKLIFYDTPGFQSPRKSLEWIKKHESSLSGEKLALAFYESFKGEEEFYDECQIFSVLAGVRGVLYIVDAARPLRKSDLAEMEILRLLGLPRIALVNSKSEAVFLKEWKDALAKTFNAIHYFNVLNSGFKERIRLFSALEIMDLDIASSMHFLIKNLKEDWEGRIAASSEIIYKLIVKLASYSIKTKLKDKEELKKSSEKLFSLWKENIQSFEEEAWMEIRKLFKHGFFAPSPDLLALVERDLFSKKSFEIFGLSRLQLAAIAGGTAATLAAGIDLALGGAFLGLISLGSGLTGAGLAYIKASNPDFYKIAGLRLSGYRLSLGPVKDTAVYWMVLDRVLILFSSLMKRSHARREKNFKREEISSLSVINPDEQKQIHNYLIFLIKKDKKAEREAENIKKIFIEILRRLSYGEN